MQRMFSGSIKDTCRNIVSRRSSARFVQHLSGDDRFRFVSLMFCDNCSCGILIFSQEQPLIKHMKSHYQSENDGKTDSEVSCKY